MPTSNPQVLATFTTTEDLPSWLRNRLIVALIPVAQGAGRKLIVRGASYAATAFLALAVKNGVNADLTSLSESITSLSVVAFDILISIISFKLHLVAKPDPA